MKSLTGEIYAEWNKNQYKSSTSGSDSEGYVVTKTPQPNLQKSSFNPINGKTPKANSRTPKPNPTVELKKPKPLNQLGAGEHNVHPKQICSPNPSKTSVGLGKRQRVDEKEGDDEIGVANKQVKLQTPKPIPKTVGPTSVVKTQNQVSSSTIDDKVLMEAMFSGGVRDLINSTLRAKVQEFDLEKKRLVLKIELQEKLDTMSEQVQRLQEQVNTLEEISFPPEFMERLGTL
ncbi:uncharacterized protein H6S33_011706 [Morchella sextelata]|uniref:uncharacterized protein n=1 Tax=Morchella sextelata TaxID=1174677 RepID=UPI001D04FDE0|nr:uncharacterized protein H6S33_011706 [Morchella sextelata]KAH0610179.1 hypothetical protein H6S33_011706 [Morchella sextelata]